MASLTLADELSRSYRQPRTLQLIRMQNSVSSMLNKDSEISAVEELCRGREQPRGVRQKNATRLAGCKPGPLSAGLPELYT